jgi:hypothetical protein
MLDLDLLAALDRELARLMSPAPVPQGQGARA